MATLQLNSRLQSRLGITPEQLANFCQRWHVYELALFGSVLRDDFSADSDIDILVSYPPTAKRGLFEKIRMQEKLSSPLHHVNLLQNPAIALFCSKQCPGDLILKTYDLAQSLRDQAIPVISGFHTPIEQDCLKIMLRSTQPIIHCPARSISKIRLSPEQKQAIGENRLLLISPFSASYPRVTAELAGKRNEMIGAIAHTIFIAYAAPNSKTLAFAQSLISAGKSVVTFASSSNPLLQEQGIVGLDIDAIVQHCLDAQISHTQKAASIDNER